MLAQAAAGPLDSPEYAYELKWDGMRILAGVRGPTLRLRSRNGLDAVSRFPELVALTECTDGAPLVLDGEIVRMVDGRPSFAALQTRIQARGGEDSRRLALAEPCALVLFDLLRDGERWLLEEPWERRRALLEHRVRTSEFVQVSPVWDDGRPVWQAACEHDLEGVMAKRRSGRYTPGRRSPAWLKIKRTDTLDVVVGGWTAGEGARGDTLGALLVGRPEGSALRFLSHVGTGFDAAALVDAAARLRPLETSRCPFLPVPIVNARPHWVRPTLVCEVQHQGWGGDGRLRAPVFIRWRPDKSPDEIG
jgi:bifunctional non-homologous end joining protein LigD